MASCEVEVTAVDDHVQPGEGGEGVDVADGDVDWPICGADQIGHQVGEVVDAGDSGAVRVNQHVDFVDHAANTDCVVGVVGCGDRVSRHGWEASGGRESFRVVGKQAEVEGQRGLLGLGFRFINRPVTS